MCSTQMASNSPRLDVQGRGLDRRGLRNPFPRWRISSSCLGNRAYAGGERTGLEIVTTADACCTTYDVYGNNDKYPSMPG